MFLEKDEPPALSLSYLYVIGSFEGVVPSSAVHIGDDRRLRPVLLGPSPRVPIVLGSGA